MSPLLQRRQGSTRLINLVFLLMIGVDEAVLWVFLYFFLDFIPTLGFLDCTHPANFHNAFNVRLEKSSTGWLWLNSDEPHRGQRNHAYVCET